MNRHTQPKLETRPNCVTEFDPATGSPLPPRLMNSILFSSHRPTVRLLTLVAMPPSKNNTKKEGGRAKKAENEVSHWTASRFEFPNHLP